VKRGPRSSKRCWARASQRASPRTRSLDHPPPYSRVFVLVEGKGLVTFCLSRSRTTTRRWRGWRGWTRRCSSRSSRLASPCQEPKAWQCVAPSLRALFERLHCMVRRRALNKVCLSLRSCSRVRPARWRRACDAWSRRGRPRPPGLLPYTSILGDV